MQDSYRRSTITLPISAAPAVAVGVSIFTAQRPMILTGAQLATTGGGASALVKVNGNAIVPAINATSAVPGYQAVANSSPAASPGGYAVQQGDAITVDITALSGATGAVVYLETLQRDI